MLPIFSFGEKRDWTSALYRVTVRWQCTTKLELTNREWRHFKDRTYVKSYNLYILYLLITNVINICYIQNWLINCLNGIHFDLLRGATIIRFNTGISFCIMLLLLFFNKRGTFVSYRYGIKIDYSHQSPIKIY